MHGAPRRVDRMSTPRFYCESPLSAAATIELPERTFHHAVRVRRMRAGESLVLFRGDGDEATATLVDIRRNSADARIESIDAVDRESPLRVVLIQGISSADRMDYTLQKAAELGVDAIVPVMAARSQGVANSRAEKRLDRWRDVVISACEQSGRNRIPVIEAITTLDHALQSIDATTRLLLSGAGIGRLREIASPAGAIALLAGPEGGLTDDEELAAVDAGFIAVTLGPRILRTETAAVAALAAMQSMWGDG